MTTDDSSLDPAEYSIGGRWIGWHGRVPPSRVEWHSVTGFHVIVENGDVHAARAANPSLSDGGLTEMQREVDDLLLAETIETRSPASVEWTETVERTVGGRTFTLFSPTVTIDWTPRRSTGDLEANANAVAALRLADRPSIRAALVQFRLAMTGWRGDANESMGRLYAAAETLVLDATGNTRRGDWRAFGGATRYGERTAEQLYWSLQFGRHVRPDLAERGLARLRLPRLNAAECIDTVAAMIRATAGLATDQTHFGSTDTTR